MLLLTLTFTLKSTRKDDVKQKYDKRDDLTFPIVKFPFISSNFPASPVHFPIHMLFKGMCTIQWFSWHGSAAEYVTSRLKSSLQKLYCRHSELVNSYEISLIWWIRVAHLLIFFLRSVAFTLCCLFLLIVHSWLLPRISLTFIKII